MRVPKDDPRFFPFRALRGTMVFLGASALMATVGCRSDGTSEGQGTGDAIVRGETPGPDSPAAKATVALARFSVAGHVSFCSGTLIAPNLVMTAAHCVDSLRTPGEFEILFAARDTDTTATSVAVESFAMARPKEGARFAPNFDMAWVKMVQNAPKGYEPVEILRSDDGLAEWLGKADSVLQSGYGRSEIACSQGQGRCAGVRYQLRNRLRRFVNLSYLQQLLVTGPQPGTGTCYGDSGGSIYAQKNGKWYALGALSGLHPALSVTPNFEIEKLCESGESVYSFAGAYIDWIEATSGVKLSFDDRANPKGRGMLPRNEASTVQGSPGRDVTLEQWLRYNNPDDPAWAATQDLVSAFAERTKRAIPHVEEVFTDPVKAAAAMEAWEALRIEGTPLDSSTFARFDRQLRDLRPIGQLKGLKKLELGSHGFSDVTPLAGLVQLEKLTLWSNVDFATNKPVPLDLGPLGKLRNLRVLDLSSNEGNLALASLPWENLVNLDELVLSWNEGVDMNALRLQALPKLRKLVIRNAQLKTIEFVAKATTLKVLDLQSNEIRDLSPLKTLTELEELDVMFNPIDGDGVLATLPKLKEIRK